MGLQKCGLNLNSAGKELLPHGSLEFPCAGYSDKYTENPENIIPWHWHEELEIAYIKEGTLRLKIQSKSFFLEKGDCFAINSNAIHYASAFPSCELQTIVFSPSLITGNNESVFAKKYILPLISCTSFNGYLLKSSENIETSSYFVNAFEALEHEIPGYEFIIRENLSKFFFFLYNQFEKEIESESIELNNDNHRIKKMLDFINSNLTENLSLSDIAKAAEIGERECLRCFQRTMQLSPMQYILKYRITHGADLLIKKPTRRISDISSLCGFNSPSNFSKMFKRFYNCTPKEYRNRS
ncbi:AraC family transcriptional regulator [Lacrimispora sp.]|uniref:AraC family transcriptional regulator n=1 Tax=Lacrimispora sp. TaxID=2719234 RepID=UPI002897D3EE|nr:AraC family transcriptional regulator [Lacrimispora sp.]